MNCPYCSNTKTKVLETRGDFRKRECPRCMGTWKTVEVVAKQRRTASWMAIQLGLVKS